MPDWKKFVRARLGPLELESGRSGEIVTEVAGYLEDFYDSQRNAGLSHEEALRRAELEVSDWTRLSSQLRSAIVKEEKMKERLLHTWLPGLVVSAAAMGGLSLMGEAGIHPSIVWLSPQLPFFLFGYWLIALPLLGALGAFWSRNAGGALPTRLVVTTFPAAVMLILFLFILAVSMFVDRHVSLGLKFSFLTLSILNWVVLPAGALLAGALPFLWNHSNKSGPAAS